MDGFVEKAFQDAIKKADIKMIEGAYEEIYPSMIEVFVRNVGAERAKQFRDEVLKKYGEEIVLMTFIFFTAGQKWDTRY